MSSRSPSAHVIMLVLGAAAGFYAFEVSYPNISALFGIYMVVALALYQVLSRLSHAPPWRHFSRTGALYALSFGFLAFYFASDAYVLERAYLEYPAPLVAFIGFGASILALVIINLLRGPRTDEIYVTHPKFVTVGVALFIIAITTQLVTMTALVDWPVQAILFRVIFIASALWTARLGVHEHRPGVTVIGIIFAIIGAMTVYLDLLWTIRETTGFMIGGIVLLATLIVAGRIWFRSTRRA